MNEITADLRNVVKKGKKKDWSIQNNKERYVIKFFVVVYGEKLYRPDQLVAVIELPDE